MPADLHRRDVLAALVAVGGGGLAAAPASAARLGFAPDGPAGAASPVECTGLDGRPRRRPTFAPAVRRRLEGDLADARHRRREQPDDPGRIAWVGRRLGYLGRYREAVEVLTAGLEAHPGDPWLLRHRGHRFITLRRFEDAARDLGRAWDAAGPRRDEVELDGIPNPANRPTGTLGTSILYHRGLARALAGDPARGADDFDRCHAIATTDDMRAAARWWGCATRIMAGDADAARAHAAAQRDDVDLLENGDYLDLTLLLSARAPRSGSAAAAGDLSGATRGFGLALIAEAEGAGTTAVARRLDAVIAAGPWASFGATAAEARRHGAASIRVGG